MMPQSEAGLLRLVSWLRASHMPSDKYIQAVRKCWFNLQTHSNKKWSYHIRHERLVFVGSACVLPYHLSNRSIAQRCIQTSKNHSIWTILRPTRQDREAPGSRKTNILIFPNKPLHLFEEMHVRTCADFFFRMQYISTLCQYRSQSSFQITGTVWFDLDFQPYHAFVGQSRLI